jgi:predicted RecB family nuclease
MALEITRKVLVDEKEFLNNTSEQVYIEQVEAPLNTEFEIEINGVKKNIKFKGYIDRIDRVGDKYRVIDYKSGRVSDDDVKFKLLPEGIKHSFLKTKHALQLSLYCLFFQKNYNCFPDEAIILSLVKSNHPFRLSYSEGISGMTELFKELTEILLNEIYNLDMAFEHDAEAKYCGYCT